MQLFYDKDITATSSSFELNEDETRHAIKVLRLQQGDRLYITNGKGDLLECLIDEVRKKTCVLSVQNTIPTPLNTELFIHLVVAPTKSQDRIEWLVEKAVEVGVSKITFIQTEHSERTKLRLDRVEKTAIAAMKQSKRFLLPELEGVIKFSNFLQNSNEESKFIAHLDEEKNIHLNQSLEKKANSVCIVIGPEGDFSQKEIEMALKLDYKCVNLGKFRLRTETAAIAACQIINSFYD